MTEKRKRTVIVKNRDDQYTIQIHTQRKEKKKASGTVGVISWLKELRALKNTTENRRKKASETISSEYQSMN